MLPPLYLAPMAEHTNPPLRLMCQRAGAQRTYTEMVNAEGLIRGGAKTHALLIKFPEEDRLIAHLYGHSPEALARAAQEVEALGGFIGIDLNAGCPVPRITQQGAGSALIKDPVKLAAIVEAMAKAVKLPISVKTRLGPHPQDTRIFEIIDRVQDAGAASIAIHARYTSQGHVGTVYLDTLAEAKARATIPVYGNGSVVDSASAITMADTGVDAILIGRAALGFPWIFGTTAMRTPSPTIEERRIAVLEHLELAMRWREQVSAASDGKALPPEEAVVLLFRMQLFRYIRGLAGANTLRGKLMELKTLQDVRDALELCFESAEAFARSVPQGGASIHE